MLCMAECLIYHPGARYQDIDPNATEMQIDDTSVIYFNDGSRYMYNPVIGEECIIYPNGLAKPTNKPRPEKDLWRVDVAGYPCYVKGESTYKHLEFINREYGRLRVLEFKLRHLLKEIKLLHLLKDESNANK